jgi:predicted ABC-type ATPase
VTPSFWLIAGPNGSGKSTLTASIPFEGNHNLIDPDAIARRMDPDDPSRAAIRAAREAITRCQEMLANRQSFTLESTLAGHGSTNVLVEAKALGYRTFVVYIALGDPKVNIDRVALRVAQGGHDVPEADIRRRHFRSLAHAAEALRIADEGTVMDNSGFQAMRMLSLRSGRIVWRADPLPAWVQELTTHLE